MTVVAVVVPFYQSSIGILTRALESVRRQETSNFSVRIIVVDDASPLALEEELATTGFKPDGRWDVVKQANGGPGAARNTALQRLTDDPPDFVAFLDSDDEWVPNHLARALGVMADGVDFYGADHQRLGEEGGTFYQIRQETGEILHRLGERRTVDDTAVFDLAGSKAIQAFVGSYLVQTSTVVYRWSALSDVRFDVSLRAAGEDHLFWLDSAALARRCSIDLSLGSRCLDGVNIYENAVSWDDPATVRRAFYLLLLWSKARVRFARDGQAARAINARLKNHRRFFAYLWLRALARRKEANIGLLRNLMRTDRIAVPRLAAALCGLAVDRWSTGAFGFIEH